MRAATTADGRITTTVTVALPNPIFVTPLQNHEFHPSQLWGPALFLGGSEDTIISPPAVNRSFFDRVPGAAALAVLTGADHNVIQGTAGRFLG